MKKVLLSAITLMAFGAVSAQETTNGGFAQGDAFISGAVGFGTESTGDIKTNVFTVSPRAAYFLTDNISLGVALGYTSVKNENPGTIGGEETTSVFDAGVFGRYYFTPASQFSLFGQLGVGYQTLKEETEGQEDFKANGFNVGLAPGISYFVSEHFALEATFGILGYNTTKPDEDNAESTDTFEFGLNMNDINFGIVYKF